MNKKLITELREITSASMKDCIDALKESNADLQKAIDLIKVKGKNITSGREGKVAAEGLIVASNLSNAKGVAMIEVNCQTDFVARSDDFRNFVNLVLNRLILSVNSNIPFNVDDPIIVEAKENIVSTTKENCVIRRWWVEEALAANAKVFNYLHNGSQLGVLLTLQISSPELINHPDFISLGNDLSMQVAAMNPLTISSEDMSPEMMERQKNIFETQLKEANKPQSTWEKILIGKFNKFYSESCLLEQDSVIVPKSQVKDVIKSLENKLNAEIKVITMIRGQVGEGIVRESLDLAEEVAKLTGA